MLRARNFSCCKEVPMQQAGLLHSPPCNLSGFAIRSVSQICLSSISSARRTAGIPWRYTIIPDDAHTPLAPAHRPWAWLGRKVEHRAACLHIDRHRDLIMHEQPLASALAPARGPTQPDTDLLPSGQGGARPV